MLPSNHSPLFAPDVDPALHAGIAAEVAVLRNLLNTSPEELQKLTASSRPSEETARSGNIEAEFNDAQSAKIHGCD